MNLTFIPADHPNTDAGMPVLASIPSLVVPPTTGNREEEDASRVVFLHGRGLGPETLSEVRRAFPTAWVLAPQGGVTLKRGHTWFLNERIGIARPESLAKAIVRFMRWFDSGETHSGKAWLCGFSNGGAFAASLLLAHPDRFLGAALLSAPLVLPPWPAGGLVGKPVFYAHGGVQDTVVPREMFDAARAYLVGPSGADVTSRSYDIGHVVADEEVSDLAMWFAGAAD
jgi:phospholipase/carboxylesterase